jgi:hypothetical protein
MVFNHCTGNDGRQTLYVRAVLSAVYIPAPFKSSGTFGACANRIQGCAWFLLCKGEVPVGTLLALEARAPCVTGIRQ